MESLIFFRDYVLLFLAVLTVLVFVHELGHFLVARCNGVRVEIFSIGFGPEIVGWNDAKGTRWRIALFPLGGYVKMFGENGDVQITTEDRIEKETRRVEVRKMTDEEIAVSFHYKTLRQRTAIVIAGPLANFVFTILVLAGLFTVVGTPKPLSYIGGIVEKSSAADAGFKKGDQIIAINAKAVTYFEDLRRVVGESAGIKLSFNVVRDGQDLLLDAVPASKAYTDENGIEKLRGLLGVQYDSEKTVYERLNPFTAIWHGVDRTVAMAGTILSTLGQMIVGDENPEQLRGVLGIAQISGDVAQRGVVEIIFFMAALSLNLGLINLFPIPMLDGGHLAFYAVEAVRGRPLGEKAQEYGFRVGLVLVLLLFLYATRNDLIHLKVFEMLKNLVT
jgi:regulator of sigma E protease